MSKKSSYQQIIKSTTIFGGSQALIILIGIIRTKIIAILLGPTGIGIIGIYQSIIDMMRSGFSLGLDTAGVKDIAETEAQKDQTALNRVISRFNIWFKWSAIIGSVICLILCYPISLWAFDSNKYTLPIAGLAICVFLAILTTGKSTILQGMRKIPEMAKSAVWGSLIGLIITTPIYFIFGLEGIIPAFIVSGGISFLCVEFYYKKQSIEKASISNKEAFHEGLSSLKLGIYIVSAGLVSTVSMFLIRAYITRTDDIEAAGLFQSAWTITNVYLALILRSMGSDFYPRLSAIASEKDKMKALINEQSYIVLIIASPIVIGMMLFSDFALSVLYSGKFSGANTLLCWQVAGSFLKVLSWPIAFIMLVKDRGFVFFISEAAYYSVYLLSAYILYPLYGLDATGIAYLAAYIVYLPLVYIIGRKLSDFKWTNTIISMILINLMLICITFFIVIYIPQYKYLGGITLCASMLYAFFKLKKVFNLKDLGSWFKKE